jgi:predicted RNase H-like nuclease (RuvC/YqgF family)
MYNSLDERPEARSARELREDLERLIGERANLRERLRASDARVGTLREETTSLAQNVCVILKTVRRELKRKEAQREELEKQLTSAGRRKHHDRAPTPPQPPR